MKRFKALVIIFILCICSGCIFGSRNNPSALRETPQDDSVKVLNIKRLREGGSLLIFPFSAGPGIEATEELDKLSLMMVKGIHDGLNEHKTPFNIISTDDPASVELILRGHVIELIKPRGIKRWMPGHNKIYLKVKGQIVDFESGKLVLLFSHQKQTREGLEDLNSLAYEIGRDIVSAISQYLNRSIL